MPRIKLVCSDHRELPLTHHPALNQSANPVEAAAGHGHVGFFVADYGEEVEVLGGNQIEGH
jgi:hypothetical protein